VALGIHSDNLQFDIGIGQGLLNTSCDAVTPYVTGVIRIDIEYLFAVVVAGIGAAQAKEIPLTKRVVSNLAVLCIAHSPRHGLIWLCRRFGTPAGNRK
jgi:hypothetical protein